MKCSVMFRHLSAALFIWSLTGCSFDRQPSLLDSQQALSLVDQGTIQLRQGDLDAAEASFTVAAQLSEPAAAIDGLGCVAFLRGDLKEAERLFWRAYSMDDDYNNSLGNLALLYESAGLESDARTMYERALRLDPANAELRNNFAVFRARFESFAGSPERAEARRELLRARAIAPNPLIEANIAALDQLIRDQGISLSR